MSAVRIIACLDVAAGRVVKGVRFQGLRPCGDPAALARRYAEQGADELVLLDVTAGGEKRLAAAETVARVARAAFLPLTVGGGIRSEAGARDLLRSGCDKVAVNSAAVRDPALVGRLAAAFGKQCVVVAVDARQRPGRDEWEVVVDAGKTPTGRDVVGWVREAERRGAGEILLTSIDRDGVGAGFDGALLRAVSAGLGVPLVASGGFRVPPHALEAVRAGADAVLAASALHRGEMSLARIKSFLLKRNVEVRPC